MPEPTEAPTKFARTQLLDTPVSTPAPTVSTSVEPSPITVKPGIAPSITPPRVGAPSATPLLGVTATRSPLPSPTRTGAAPTATKSASNCAPLTSPVIKSSGLVKSAQLGKMDNSILAPTTVFESASKIHLVVTVQNAPANTRVKAGWYAIDVGKAAPCNTFVDAAELTSLDGSFTVDFSLDPTNPVGAYRVEVSVNGTLDQILAFNIK